MESYMNRTLPHIILQKKKKKSKWIKDTNVNTQQTMPFYNERGKKFLNQAQRTKFVKKKVDEFDRIIRVSI